MYQTFVAIATLYHRLMGYHGWPFNIRRIFSFFPHLDDSGKKNIFDKTGKVLHKYFMSLVEIKSNAFKERLKTQWCYNSVSHSFCAKHRGSFM